MVWLLLGLLGVAVGLAGVLGAAWRKAWAAAREALAAQPDHERRLQELRRVGERNAAILQNAMDGFFVLGEDYRFLEVNDAFCRMTGYSTAELLGMSMTDLEASNPEVNTGRAGSWRTGLHHFATAHRHKDGHIVQLESCVIVLRDGDRKMLAGFSRDVTERYRADERLHAAHARFESLVAGMPLGYVVWSPDFRVLEWNPAASTIFGYSAAEALGRRASELIVPAEGQRAFAELCAALLKGQACVGSVLENRKRDGEKTKCEWFSAVLPNSAGGLHGVATLVRDVSERERLETQLRQSQKLESLGVLAGGVAHDFNNLLVGIMGNASLAMEQLPANAPVQRLLEKVVNAGRRATELTQRMLAYAGRANCDVRILDLNALVHEMADFAVAAIPKNVALRISTTDGVPLIKADSGQVQQVIMNLLINAAEAIGERGGEVCVSTWSEPLAAEQIAQDLADQNIAPGIYVGLEVRDDGGGMPPEILGRIYDPFFSTKFAGRGLGLSAILGIVRAHRGAISVSSQVGVGTVFRVLLPAAAAKSAPPPPEGQAPALPRGSTVLVIDDEEEILDVVAAVLAHRGMRVLTAANGRQGIELFKQHADQIDVVLLDMNMPGMSGGAVFEALRAHKPDVRVLLSTGYSEQEAAKHFADAPLAGFVHKPYTASALIDQIGAAMATY